MQPSVIVTGTIQILNKLTEWYKVVHSCIISNCCCTLPYRTFWLTPQKPVV